MTILHTLLHFTWALPQTLLGLILRGCGYIEKITAVKRGETTILYGVKWLKDSLFSLGRYVFYPMGLANHMYFTDMFKTDIVLHELGHSKQSLILGWFYLPVIALPSLLWHVWYYAGKPKKISYYAFFTEKWANKLAGIEIE